MGDDSNYPGRAGSQHCARAGLGPDAHVRHPDPRVGEQVLRQRDPGIPILVILFYVYFVLPDIGIQLSAFEAGMLGLGIAYSAYMAEVFRSGIEAVDAGQIEAAQSIGMRRGLIMRRVILPQAFKVALPSYGNNLIMLLKDSSQTSAITVAELALQSKLIASSTFKNLTVFSMSAICYLLMSIPLIMLVGHLERKFGKAK